MKIDHARIGKYLRDKRIEGGFTQAEVAKRLGHSTPQFVSNCERGLCSLPLSAIRKLIKMYRMDPKEVMDLLLEEQEKYLHRELFGRSNSRKAASE